LVRDEKNLNSLKEDLNSKRYTLGSNTSSEKMSKLLSLARQRNPNKTKERFEDKQEKIKERELNQFRT